MSGMNKAILIGNLGADPELKFTQGGQSVLKMRLATTEKWKDKDGQTQEKTEWHSVVLWGKRAEALSKFLAKGKTICVEGRIQTRSYEDKDGVKKYATEINATEVVLLGGGGGGEDRGRPQSRPQAGNQRAGRDEPDDFVDDDIPFDGAREQSRLARGHSFGTPDRVTKSAFVDGYGNDLPFEDCFGYTPGDQ